MIAFFANPMTLATSQLAGSYKATGPLVNLLNDLPNMKWKSDNASDNIVVSLNGASLDTVALWGSNLTASQTVRIRIGPNADGTGAVYDATIQGSENTLSLLPQAYTGAYLRLDFNRGSLAQVEVSRLILSMRLEFGGISQLAERGLEDQTTSQRGANWSVFDLYKTLTTWKFTIDDLTDDDWFPKWEPFLRDVGISKGFIFVPYYPSPYLNQLACFARFSSSPKTTWTTGVDMKLDVSLLSI
jgi:hypothetical protein